MKFKDLETAKKYFLPIFQEDKLPSKLTQWSENFTEKEHNNFINLWKEDEKIKKKCLVVSDDSELYYFENFLVYEIGHSRRGQFYFLLCEIETLEISVLATKPEGSGSKVLMPNQMINWIKDGEIIN